MCGSVSVIPLLLPDLRPDMQESAARTKYDLVANICHDSLTEQGAAVRGSSGEVADPLTSGSYRVHVRNDCTGQARLFAPPATSVDVVGMLGVGTCH